MDTPDLNNWIGKEEVVHDHIGEGPLRAMAATLSSLFRKSPHHRFRLYGTGCIFWKQRPIAD